MKRHPKQQYSCASCGIPFMRAPSLARSERVYCSRSCASLFRIASGFRPNPKTSKTHPCANCGKSFERKPSNCRSDKLCCSHSCGIELRRREGRIGRKRGGALKNCGHCNAEFYSYPCNVGRDKYCSTACHDGARSDEARRLAMATGGRGTSVKRVVAKFTNAQRRKWLDDECASCGSHKSACRKMHLDHILAVSNGGTNAQSNAQTLCDVCNLRKLNAIDKPLNKLLAAGIPLIDAARMVGAPLPSYLR